MMKKYPFGQSSNPDEPYLEPGNPFANPNRKPPNGSKPRSKSGKRRFTCPYCGRVQDHKGFCLACGTQIK